MKLCEEQYSYIAHMTDQADADMSSLRIQIYNKGYGELLGRNQSHYLQYRRTTRSADQDKFLNGWYQNSVFGEVMDDSSDDESDGEVEDSEFVNNNID
jgi:hypothetical protein